MIRTSVRFKWWAVAASAFLATTVAEAQSPGRVHGVVKDVGGQPIPGVTVTVTSPNVSDYEVVSETNKKGQFLVAHADVTIGFIYTFSKEGYQTQQRPLRPQVGGLTEVEIVLPSTQATPPQQELSLTGTDRAIRTFNEGVEAKRAGDLELAEQRFHQALQLDPELAAAHTALAGLAYVRGDYAAAAAEAERALALDPSDERALQLSFDAYHQAGDEEKAAAAAEALRRSGKLAEAAARIYNEGVDAYRAGDADVALVKFEQAVALDPELVRALVALAQVNLASGRAEQAADVADRALALEPANTDALKIRYDAARRLGDAETARLALQRLSEVDPEWAKTGLFDHAVDLYNEGQMDAAADAFRRVLEADPNHPRAHYLLGMAFFNLGEVKAAKEHLERFLELAPEDPEARIAREVLAYAQ